MRVHICHQSPATHRCNERLFFQVIQSPFVKSFTFEIVEVTASVLILMLILKSCFTLYLTFEKKVLHAILETLVLLLTSSSLERLFALECHVFLFHVRFHQE